MVHRLNCLSLLVSIIFIGVVFRLESASALEPSGETNASGSSGAAESSASSDSSPSSDVSEGSDEATAVPEATTPDVTAAPEMTAAADVKATPEASEKTADSSALSETPSADAPQSASDKEPEGNVDKEKKEKKKKKKKKVKVRARIHTRWEMTHKPQPEDSASQDADNEYTNEFLIRRARFKLMWEPESWLTAVLQVGGFHRMDGVRRLLRDAYLHFSPLSYLQMRAGFFKKPFSRLALRSSGKLRIVERGEGNELILDDLGYGGRDIGVQFSGRLIPSLKLNYELGFFNGTNITDGDNLENGDEKDIVARMKIRPAKWLDIGVNGSFKFFSKKEKLSPYAWAAGADAVMKLAGVRLHLEGILAADHRVNNVLPNVEETTPPLIVDFVGILSYRADLGGELSVSVEPVFMLEMLDPDSKVADDQMLLFGPGFNAYFGKYFRIMVHGEFRHPFRNTPGQPGREDSEDDFSRREKLIIQLCFDI